MEYDRSFYKVYERVMDDLNSSPAVATEENDGIVPFFVPICAHDLLSRYFQSRNFCYVSIRQQLQSIQFNSSHSSYNSNQNRSNNLEQQRFMNPMYSRLSHRMQERLGEHRRAFIVSDATEDMSEGNQNGSNTNLDEPDYSTSTNQSFSSGTSSSLDSSSDDSSSSLESHSRQLRQRQRRQRRERRMHRRQLRINEPIQETLRRIRNQENARRALRANDDSDDASGCTQKNLFWFMQFSMFFAIFHLFVLAILHHTYVEAGLRKHHTQLENPDNLINVHKTCLEYALQTRPPSQRSSYGENSNKAYANLTKSEILERRPLFGQDEILQIKILYGSACSGQCSRVHTVIPIEQDTISNKSDKSNPSPNNQENVLVNSTDPSHINYYSTAKYWENPHYRYTSMEAIMFLEDQFILEQNLSVVNVTLTERCLSSGNDDKEIGVFTKIAELLSQAYGMDAVIINQLMYGIRRPPSLIDDSEEENNKDKKKQKRRNEKEKNLIFSNGYLQNLMSKERWNWSHEILEQEENRHPIKWFFDKLGVLFASSLSFFLTTSVTAVVVRVLTGSGVVLMFPIFYLFHLFGIPGADFRILGLSYPWIGQSFEAMRRQNIQPASHLIWAHMGKLMLYYLMYEACNATWSSVLYGKSVPETMTIWIFGMAMCWEYFLMVFVRSAMSVYFFPRITFIYYTCFHIYFYSVPYGYFDIALVPLFFFMVQAMLYTILALELPAASRGVISLECPREVYTKLSWPEWTANLPEEWTLFLPLNSRYIPLHDRTIDERDPENETGSESGEEMEEIHVERDVNDSSSVGNEASVEQEHIENIVELSPSRPGLHARRTGTSDRGETENAVYSNV